MDIREKIADLQHDQWVGWMKYLFSKCYFKDGCYVIPQWAQARWSRQMETPYNELPLDERDSDRKEADKVLALVEQYYMSPEMVKGLVFEVVAKKTAEVEDRLRKAGWKSPEDWKEKWDASEHYK